MSTLAFFLTVLKISAVTFGGGYTIVPVMIEEFSVKRDLIDKETMVDLVALGQSAPGPIAVSTAFLLGYKLKGRFGALIGAIAAVIPPLFIITVIYFFYSAIATNRWVRAALRGMNGAIAACMLLAVWDLAKVALKKHRVFSAVIMAASFAVAWFTTINIALVIAALALIGFVTFTIHPGEDGP